MPYDILFRLYVQQEFTYYQLYNVSGYNQLLMEMYPTTSFHIWLYFNKKGHFSPFKVSKRGVRGGCIKYRFDRGGSRDFSKGCKGGSLNIIYGF
jgi:hypothetical protein